MILNNGNECDIQQNEVLMLRLMACKDIADETLRQSLRCYLSSVS